MNWPAALWTFISVAGIGVSVTGLRDIAADRRALAARDGALRMLITTRARRQWIRLGAFALYTLVGLDALLPWRFPAEGLLLLTAVLGGLLALVLNALLEQVDRAMIRKIFP